MSFAVRYSVTAKDALARLYDYLLDRAVTLEDLDLAERALAAIAAAVGPLNATSRSPRSTSRAIWRSVPSCEYSNR